MKPSETFTPDFMFPKGEGKNRKERILVEVDNVIRSNTEAVFYALKKDPKMLERINATPELSDISQDKFFYLYNMIPSELFLAGVEGVNPDKLNTETLIEYRNKVEKYLEVDTWGECSRTSLQYAISELSTQNFVTEVCFTSRRSLQRYEANHLIAMPGSPKFRYFTGSVSMMLETIGTEQNPFTTVFMQDHMELIEILKNPEKYHIGKTLFVLVNSALNTEYVTVDSSGKRDYTELYNKELRELSEDKPWQVARCYLMRLEDLVNISQGG